MLRQSLLLISFEVFNWTVAAAECNTVIELKPELIAIAFCITAPTASMGHFPKAPPEHSEKHFGVEGWDMLCTVLLGDAKMLQAKRACRE